MKEQKYYALELDEETKEADLMIFGDITSYPWMESDVSSYNLSKKLAELDADRINVHINSYGGEVAEGLAIYNTLKQHRAKIRTYCDGFACSIASVIFMSGDERIMSNASMLMVHNPWTYASGNAAELRKTAEDLDKMAQASVNAYMENATITEEEIKTLMDEETWILPQEALDYGFATSVTGTQANEKYSQSVRKKVFQILTNQSVQLMHPPKSEPKPELKENVLLKLFADMKEI